MEHHRYSRRLRAKAVERLSAQGKESTNADGILLRSTLDRPEYHPDLGTVMTAAQLDDLKQQITVYATICKQLVEMHKASVAASSNPNPNGKSTIGNSSSMQAAPVKVTTRHRWTPSQPQLQFLEKLFETGIGTPDKQKVRDITAQLSQHGPITESNVYNWFQNRKARTRRRNRQSQHSTPESGDDDPASAKISKQGSPDVQAIEEKILFPLNAGGQFPDSATR